ncbi:MAG TPA: 4'-phosphopantetheinyl transferase superfamily protein [Steroidobacteraceae bacterium]|nr:4'-phosphopantetheinyl transferase superfamily protein [Steroidobacteraceae bacterium]
MPANHCSQTRPNSTRSAAIEPSGLLNGLFPSGVIAFEARGPVAAAALMPAEARCVARAVPKRVGEFAAGRACARAALAALNIADFALCVGPDREPLWPEGITGSITHCAGYCGVVVARTTCVAGLGVDAERCDAVQRRLWDRITVDAERAWLEQLPESAAAHMAALIFSAKESFFKCQFPLTRNWLNFSDVSVSIESSQSFIIQSRADPKLASLPNGPWRGRFVIANDLVVTGIGVQPRAAGAL